MVFAALAAAQAAGLGRSAQRGITIGLAVCGLLSVLVAVWNTRKNREDKDVAWFGIGAVVNAAVLLLVFLAPGALNQWWGFAPPPPPPDPNAQVVVPYQDHLGKGRIAEDGWADAATEAIRFGRNAVVRVEYAKLSRVQGMGDAKYLVVCVRFANLANQFFFTGFAGDTLPVLKDESGRELTLKNQLIRQRISAPAPVFEPAPTGPINIKVGGGNPSQDVMLVFEAPPALQGLTLELPAKVIGRDGICKLRIAQPIESLFPDKNE
jgi:hypothetical protein